MKASRFIRQFYRAGASACQSIIPNGFNALHTLRQFEQVHRVGITQPQAPARTAVDEFVRAIPAAKVFLRSRFLCDKGLFLFVLKEIKTAVDRLVPDSNFRNIAKRMLAAFYENIIPIDQVPVNVIDLEDLIFLENSASFLLVTY